MDANAVIAFARVVEAGSFTAAARRLEMPKSTVSRKVAELEDQLDARLLHRTTRTLSLTDAGRAFYPHAARIADEVDTAARAVTRLQETPRGRLRMTCPLAMPFLGPVVAAYLERYPEVELEVFASDRRIDLIDEGYDLALRAGELSDSSLIARPLVSWSSLVVANDAYRERCGLPSNPGELADHQWLVFGELTQLSLVSGDRRFELAIEPRLASNDLDLIETAVAGGIGLALLPAFRCAVGVESGSLCEVLPGWRASPVALHALYPSRRYLPPAVSAFVELAGGMLGEMEWARWS